MTDAYGACDECGRGMFRLVPGVFLPDEAGQWIDPEWSESQSDGTLSAPCGYIGGRGIALGPDEKCSGHVTFYP